MDPLSSNPCCSRVNGILIIKINVNCIAKKVNLNNLMSNIITIRDKTMKKSKMINMKFIIWLFLQERGGHQDRAQRRF